jgi:hypothetical protein
MSNTTNSSPVYRTLDTRWITRRTRFPVQPESVRESKGLTALPASPRYRNRTAAGAGENNVRETWKYTERTVKDNDTEAK